MTVPPGRRVLLRDARVGGDRAVEEVVRKGAQQLGDRDRQQDRATASPPRRERRASRASTRTPPPGAARVPLPRGAPLTRPCRRGRRFSREDSPSLDAEPLCVVAAAPVEDRAARFRPRHRLPPALCRGTRARDRGSLHAERAPINRCQRRVPMTPHVPRGERPQRRPTWLPSRHRATSGTTAGRPRARAARAASSPPQSRRRSAPPSVNHTAPQLLRDRGPGPRSNPRSPVPRRGRERSRGRETSSSDDVASLS